MEPQTLEQRRKATRKTCGYRCVRALLVVFVVYCVYVWLYYALNPANYYLVQRGIALTTQGVQLCVVGSAEAAASRECRRFRECYAELFSSSDDCIEWKRAIYSDALDAPLPMLPGHAPTADVWGALGLPRPPMLALPSPPPPTQQQLPQPSYPSSSSSSRKRPSASSSS